MPRESRFPIKRLGLRKGERAGAPWGTPARWVARGGWVFAGKPQKPHDREGNQRLLQELFRRPLGLIGSRAPALGLAAARPTTGPLLRGPSGLLLSKLLSLFSYLLSHARETRSLSVGGLDTFVSTPRSVVRNIFSAAKPRSSRSLAPYRATEEACLRGSVQLRKPPSDVSAPLPCN